MHLIANLLITIYNFVASVWKLITLVVNYVVTTNNCVINLSSDQIQYDMIGIRNIIVWTNISLYLSGGVKKKKKNRVNIVKHIIWFDE